MQAVEGRKPRSGRSEEHVQMSVRMPADVVAALEREAAEADRTLSAEVRRILRRHLDSLGRQEATA